MGTRQLDLGCTFRHQAAWPTAALLHVVPAVPTDGGDPAGRRNPGIIFKDEKWTLEPQIEIHPYQDAFGNQIQRFTMPQGVSTVSYSVRAEVPDELDAADENAPEIPPTDLPDDTLVYTLASRFCHNDVLSGQAWKLFGGMEPGYGRCSTPATERQGRCQGGDGVTSMKRRRGSVRPRHSPYGVVGISSPSGEVLRGNSST